jgi:TonB family protein
MCQQKLLHTRVKIEKRFRANKIMRFCPTCQTRYDEEILRFCIKDGTPLVEENQPNFTELPSESGEDDFGEETIIRRNSPKLIEKAPETAKAEPNSPRIVIPTTQKVKEQQIRTKTTTASYRQPPPRESNTGKIVLLTVLGTLITLMGAGIVYLFLSRSDSGDSNQNKIVNANFNSIDMNLNANLSVGNPSANFNFNANTNTNVNVGTNTNLNLGTNTNFNAKANAKTPTPKTPTPTPNANANSGSSNSNLASPPPAPTVPRPSVSPTPTATPKNTPPDLPANRPVNAGVLNGRAVNLPKPAYPPIAKQMRASGQVAVQVFVDEGGNVTAARATSGNSLLRAPAEAAARQSRFNPIIVGDRAVKATGIVVYNFINQ